MRKREASIKQRTRDLYGRGITGAVQGDNEREGNEESDVFEPASPAKRATKQRTVFIKLRHCSFYATEKNNA